MAAVLACGSRAVVSHVSAAALWNLLPAPAGPVHVSVPGISGRERRRGIRIHRRRHLPDMARAGRKGIPVTTPAQTIADLRRVVAPAQLRRAIRQAEVLGLRTGVVRREPTRSELEDLFLRLCERHGMPKPEVNVMVGRYEVDFLWRSACLIVETDGYKYHRGSQAFEDDHARTLALRAAGFDVLPFTFRQVSDEPDRVAGLVSSELRKSGAGTSAPPHLPASPD